MRTYEMNRISLPEPVKRIINTLEKGGFEAFAVGGSVRDSVLGDTPEDWDITTSALPHEVKRLFKRTIDTGIKHGTVTVMQKGVGYEITTYRIDGVYEDSRHPTEVHFTGELKEDLSRRDFTINAMAYNERVGFVDPFNGLEDLENGIIRAVGEPEKRFTEDALRILRAFRFAAKLSFSIEEKTLSAARALAHTLSKISGERIRDELTKLLMSPNPGELRELYRAGITKVILPELDRCMEEEQHNPHHSYTVGEHIICSIERSELDFALKDCFRENGSIDRNDLFRLLRLALLFHDMGKPFCRSVDEAGIYHYRGHAAKSEEIAFEAMKRLKEDNRTIKLVCSLVKHHDYRPNADKKSVRRAINRIGKDIFPLLFDLRRSDILAQSDYYKKEKLEFEETLKELYLDIIEKEDCVSIRDLKLNGRDLMEECKLKQGKEVGDMLHYLLDLVLEKPELNTREALLEACRNADIQNPPGF